MPLPLDSTCCGTILIVEDDARFTSSLENLLVNEGWKVERAGTVSEAQARLDSLNPSLVLVDLQLPDGNGLDIVELAVQSQPPIPALIVTVYGTDENLRSAISLGASGYLLKDDPMADFVRAIDACLAGHWPISPQAAQGIVQPMRDLACKATAYLERLSGREREVMALLGAGCQYSEVAAQLGVTVGTVQTYVKRLYLKLDVNSKAEVAWLAAEWKDFL